MIRNVIRKHFNIFLKTGTFRSARNSCFRCSDNFLNFSEVNEFPFLCTGPTLSSLGTSFDFENCLRHFSIAFSLFFLFLFRFRSDQTGQLFLFVYSWKRTEMQATRKRKWNIFIYLSFLLFIIWDVNYLLLLFMEIFNCR